MQDQGCSHPAEGQESSVMPSPACWSWMESDVAYCSFLQVGASGRAKRAARRAAECSWVICRISTAAMLLWTTLGRR